MRGYKGLLPLALVGIAGLAWLLVLSEPGSRLVAYWLTPHSGPGPTLGRVVHLEGTLTRVHGGEVERVTNLGERPFELHDGDRIETDDGSSAVVLLASQDELDVKPSSIISFQLWNERDGNSPVYVDVLSGDVSARKTGVRGRAYVTREGRLYLPGQTPGHKSAPLVVTREAKSDLAIGEVTPPAPATDFPADETPTSDDAVDLTKDDPETLANEYIEEMIASRQGQLQKCWLARLKDRPDLKGQLTLQFEISRRGKVRGARVIDSELPDETLHKCVASVVERLPFRSFRGPEVTFTYPIRFE